MSEKGEAPKRNAAESLAKNAAHSAGGLGKHGTQETGAQAVLCTPGPTWDGSLSPSLLGVLKRRDSLCSLQVLGREQSKEQQ